MGGTEQPTAAVAFDQKLRNKMLLRVVGTAGVILLTLGAVTFLSARSLLAEELKQKSRSKVEYAATVIDAWLHEKGEVLSILADRESRQAMPDELKQAYFRDVAEQYGGFESVYMGFEQDGGFVTGAEWVPPKDYDPRKRPWYMAAVAARGVAYSTPYRDMFTDRIVVSVAAPVYDGERLRGVMAMDIFVDDILGVVDSLRVGRSGHAFVVDAEGTFVAHPDPAQVLVGTIGQTGDAALFATFRQRATRTTSAVYEAEDYVTIGHIAENDWHVVFHLPFDEVSRPLRTLALIFFGGILAALLVLALTINYISHNIARPILKLVDGARDISGGEYERSLPVESRDEVGYLTQSFNEMALGLKDREFIKSTFGRYVSPDVMREILAGNVALGGEAKVISVMFCDIRGFTTLSENMGPHELVTLLNRYFTRMDRVISAHGGFINKYLGDGILAMFGAPVALEGSAHSAVEAAYAMLEQLAEFNQRHGLSLQVGIGIHTGEAVVGNIGSEQRTEYTVIGDSVNLASRIESVTKRYGVPILISEDTARGLSDQFALRVMDRVRVKGKNEPVTLLSPLVASGLSAPDRERVDRSNQAVELYFRGEFGAALEVVSALEGELDVHLETIRDRCRTFVTAPPAAWDGVVTFESK